MKSKRNRGEVVVEASIVVTLVVIFITVMLFIGMILYQRTVTTVLANQTAANMALTYSNSLRDPFTGYVDPDKAYQSVTYSTMRNSAYNSVMEQKTAMMAKYRLNTTRILPEESTDVDVQIIKKPNELLKNQIVVTIRTKYELPLVGFFGVDNTIEFAASGRADCVDYIEYMNGVEAIGDPEESPIPSLPESDTCIVTFIMNKYDGGFVASVPVLRGESVKSSNRYSHSTMPATPRFNELEFICWATSNGTKFTNNTIVNENTTVYGRWYCKLTFHPEGGRVAPEEMKVEYKKTATFPTPVREGYAFEGWYTGKEGAGTKYESGITELNGNVHLYAKWRCTHDFALERETGATCVTKAVKYYKCVRCPETRQDEGHYGSHNYVHAETHGSACEGYYVYRCTHCGASYNVNAGWGHDYRGRCNIPHGVKAWTFKCSSNRDPKTGNYNPCSTTSMYHFTCARCGIIYRKTTAANGQKFSCIYHCGTHYVRSAPVTGCGHN